MANYTVDRLSDDTNTYRFKDNVSGYTSNAGTVEEVAIDNIFVSDYGAANIPIPILSDIVYPVGCYYETSDSTFNPNTAWGGIWELVQQGEVAVSADTLGTNLISNPTSDAGQSHDTYIVADFNLTTSTVEGAVYTVSAYVNTSSEKTGVGFYHSGGKSLDCCFPSTNVGTYFIPVNDSHIYTTTFVGTAQQAAYTTGDGHGFIRVYVSNNPDGGPQGDVALAGTANVEWIKIQQGYGINSTGGRNALSRATSFTIPGYAITTSQIKAHNHSAAGKTFSFAGRQRGSSSGMSASDLSAVVHESSTMSVTGENYGDSSVSYIQSSSVSQTGYCDVVTLNFAHTHTSVGGGATHTHTFSSTAAEVTTMQPYVVVNRWHKIASASNTPVLNATISMSIGNSVFNGWVNNNTGTTGKVTYNGLTYENWVEGYFDIVTIQVGNLGTFTSDPDTVTSLVWQMHECNTFSSVYTTSLNYKIKISHSYNFSTNRGTLEFTNII